jgi:hypothetical protein
MTERNAPITHPSEATDSVSQVPQQAQQVPAFSGVGPSQQVPVGFNCIRPTVRPMENDNIVSLSGKGAQYSIAVQQPQLVMNVPQVSITLCLYFIEEQVLWISTYIPY